jgi:Ca2+-binding EF-hand superfamily protein
MLYCVVHVQYTTQQQQGPEVVALLKRFDTDGDGRVSLQVL